VTDFLGGRKQSAEGIRKRFAGRRRGVVPAATPAMRAPVPHHPASRESSMLPKLVIAIVISVLAYIWEGTRPYSLGIAIVAFIIAFVIEGLRVVPQQSAWVVERLGKFHEVLQPGLNVIIPFFDRVAYRHSLKEVPFDVPEQVCITKDNTQLAVDGIVYYQVTDARLASYGTSDYLLAITQIVSVLDQAGRPWGVKVLRYEVKNLTPPEAILRSMQQQITAEREKRALIAKSEGERQQQINVADGEKQAAVLNSEGQKTAAINQAQGEATALRLVAEATAAAVRAVAEAINTPGGQSAANLKVAEQYIQQFGHLAKTNNTMIVPSNLSDVASVVASAMTVLERTKAAAQQS
jgi:regulator of protease activity HflC (stomatin/prohibitin superfamily)